MWGLNPKPTFGESDYSCQNLQQDEKWLKFLEKKDTLKSVTDEIVDHLCQMQSNMIGVSLQVKRRTPEAAK